MATFKVEVQKRDKTGRLTTMKGIFTVDEVVDAGEECRPESLVAGEGNYNYYIAPMVFEVEKAVNKSSEYRLHILEV